MLWNVSYGINFLIIYYLLIDFFFKYKFKNKLQITDYKGCFFKLFVYCYWKWILLFQYVIYAWFYCDLLTKVCGKPIITSRLFNVHKFNFICYTHKFSEAHCSWTLKCSSSSQMCLLSKRILSCLSYLSKHLMSACSTLQTMVSVFVRNGSFYRSFVNGLAI